MGIKQTRTYTPPAGYDHVIPITEWADTLPETERREFYASQQYQISMERAFKTLGKLTVDGDVYTWDSQETIDRCGTDPTYAKYHARYLDETGITLTITTETV